MSIVEIDDRGRVTIPKEMRVDADKALVIPMGESYMLVPIPRAPIEFEIKGSTKTAKATAERRLRSEVRGRLARRRQS
jgi:bifunctional DNA-binding transcriptional regulator/antitoxin component of YhaV-PrlF toxin-antitoxin module